MVLTVVGDLRTAFSNHFIMFVRLFYPRDNLFQSVSIDIPTDLVVVGDSPGLLSVRLGGCMSIDQKSAGMGLVFWCYQYYNAGLLDIKSQTCWLDPQPQ